jgi:hypothetical protein
MNKAVYPSSSTSHTPLTHKHLLTPDPSYFGNRILRKHSARGDFAPEVRLHIMCVGGTILPFGLFLYGWSVQYRTLFLAPMLGTGIIGFGLIVTFMSANTYVVDVFSVHAASAIAVNTVLRSLLGAVVPLSSQGMYAAMGYGWGNSVLGFVALALVPVPFAFVRYGKGIRERSAIKL